MKLATATIPVYVITIYLVFSFNAYAELYFFGYTASPGEQANIRAAYSPPPTVTAVTDIKSAEDAINLGLDGVFLNLENEIWNFVSPSPGDCADYGERYATGGVTYSLKENYKSSIQSFIAANPSLLTDPDKIKGYVVASEINNGCASIAEIEEVAYYIKTEITDRIPLIVGDGLSGMSRPYKYPDNIDIIAPWNYGCLDPADGSECASRYSEVLRLLGNRKVIWVLESYCGYRQFDSGLISESCSSEYVNLFNKLVINYGNWFKSRPEIIGAIAFTWGDFKEGGVNLGAQSMTGLRPAHQFLIHMVDGEYIYEPAPIIEPGKQPGLTTSPTPVPITELGDNVTQFQK